ncbi:MAG: phage holin family protein [Bacillota bacterium]|nr:phage holin family protein [Bacillota bacterium]
MLLLRWLLTTVAILIVGYAFPNLLRVENVWTAIIGALFLGLANALIRPILLILTLPINILTLGLFTLIINGLMLWAVVAITPGMAVGGFWAAVLAALIISLISGFLNWMVES